MHAGDFWSLKTDPAVQGKSELSRKLLRQCKEAWSDTMHMVISVALCAYTAMSYADMERHSM